MSPPELALWLQLRALRDSGYHFRRQSAEGPYFLDFVCRRHKLVVEVDGVHHADATQAEHDKRRDTYLLERGFRVLRFWASDVENEIDGVMIAVRDALGSQGEPIHSPELPSVKGGARYRSLVRLGLRRKD